LYKQKQINSSLYKQALKNIKGQTIIITIDKMMTCTKQQMKTNKPSI